MTLPIPRTRPRKVEEVRDLDPLERAILFAIREALRRRLQREVA